METEFYLNGKRSYFEELLSEMSREISDGFIEGAIVPRWDGQCYETTSGKGIYIFEISDEKVRCSFKGFRNSFRRGTRYFQIFTPTFPKSGDEATFVFLMGGRILVLKGKVLAFETSKPDMPLYREGDLTAREFLEMYGVEEI